MYAIEFDNVTFCYGLPEDMAPGQEMVPGQETSKNPAQQGEASADVGGTEVKLLSQPVEVDVKKTVERGRTDETASGKTDGTQVLQGANFTLSYGELAVLSGYSGEGKSTVLALASGIIPNVTPGEIQGDIRIDGQSIRGKKIADICKKVGVVLQNAEAQIIQQRVDDEVAFGCENMAIPPEEITARIEDACHRMQLEPAWATRTLSGGQKQRLITATTLAMGQKILLFDEPLANLDKEGATLLMEELRNLTKQGYGVLLVEHRLDMVLPYADRVWRIARGKTEPVEDVIAYEKAQTGCIADTGQQAEKSDSQILMRLEHASFSVKNRTILRDVNLEIAAGKRYLFLGENGCGKTTLLRMLAKLNPLSSGVYEQWICSKKRGDKISEKLWYQKVGVIYQNPNYQLFMPTVRQEIAYGAVDEAYAQEILQRFGLTDLAERHPHSLSEGQKRRVSIAAVVAARPQVLLLDEPTVGQDYEGLREMIYILNDLHRSTGNTMITITHDKRCAEALCDVAFLLEDGVIRVRGGKELVRRYLNPLQ